jgi:hypothetical protein
MLAHGMTLHAMHSAAGGGKPKMRGYFGHEEWPINIVNGMPDFEEAQATVIDTTSTSMHHCCTLHVITETITGCQDSLF